VILIGVHPHKSSHTTVAIEGARGLGRTLAQQLAAAGENVVDMPSTLWVRARLLATG
jgi:NAD(P)-dependent dehydrogenase (short-subunit alcohol dehydrogenase family)